MSNVSSSLLMTSPFVAPSFKTKRSFPNSKEQDYTRLAWGAQISLSTCFELYFSDEVGNCEIALATIGLECLDQIE